MSSSSPDPVYFDAAATTRPAPEVLEAVREAATATWGNAASAHGFGQAARRIVDAARVEVAALIGAKPEEIVFTSGATESNNTVLKGVTESLKAKGTRLITTAVEHPCVLETAQYLGHHGITVTVLKVDGQAVVDLGALTKALAGEKTALVSVMLANNEVGTIEPVAEAAAIARAHGAAVHTDATQAVGRIPVDVNALGVDYLSLSAHKFHGPKGIGALYVRRGSRLTPLLHGGNQEQGRRSGTLNVPGIAGLGAAAALARRELTERAARIADLRDRLQRGILATIEHVHVNGHPERRLPSHLNASFDFVEGEAMLMSLDLKGVAVSTGSACSSGSLEPSHVLTAMGLGSARAHASLRFSLSAYNTRAEVDRVLEVLPPVIARLRSMSPAYADFLKHPKKEIRHAAVQ